MKKLNLKKLNVFRQYNKIKAYKEVFQSEKGQIILEDLVASFSVMKPSFFDCPRKSAYKEGQKSVVLSILKVLDIDDLALIEEIKKIKNQYGGQNNERKFQTSPSRTGLPRRNGFSRELQKPTKT